MEKPVFLRNEFVPSPYLRDTTCKVCHAPIQIGPNDFQLCDNCLDISTGHGLIQFD